MKKLLGMLIAVALLAAPAMAVDSTSVNINMTVDPYARMQGWAVDNSEFLITLTDGAASGSGEVWVDLVSNDPATTVQSTLNLEASPTGTWAIGVTQYVATGTPGLQNVGITINVTNVPVNAKMTNVKQATLVLTVAPGV